MAKQTDSLARDQKNLPDRLNDLRFADFLQEIVACFDPQLRHIYVNSAVERATGRPACDFIGKTNRELGMPAAQVEQWDRLIGEVFRSGQPGKLEFSFATPDGERLFLSQLLPQTDARGVVKSVMTIARDVGASQTSGLTAEYFNAIIENSDDAIIGKTLDGTVTSWNRGAEVIFGYSRAEMIGSSLLVLFPENRKDEERFIVERLRLGEKVDHFETERIRKDGSRVRVSVTISPIRNANGVIIGASSVARDITPISVENERLQMVLDATGDGLWDWDLRTGRVYRSAHYYQIIGWGAEDDTHDFAFFQRTVHPLDWPRVQGVIGDYVAGKLQRIEFEYRPVTKSGDSEKWVLAKGRAVERNDEGRPIRIVGTLSDVTQSKLAEVVLRDREQRLSRVLEGSDQGYWDWNVQTSDLVVSARWETMLGYEPGELNVSNGQWAQIVHPDDLPPTMEVVHQQIRGEIDKFESKMRLRTKSGDWRWVVSRGKVVEWDGQGKALMMSGTHTDITEQEILQEELKKSASEKEALLKEVHHRVKNNLQVINSLLSLESQRSAIDDTRTVLGDMRARIRAMALLHESLYRTGVFASVELGSYLHALASQVFRGQANSSSIVRLVVDLAPVQVSMDFAAPCGLMVNELISNSLKHGFPQERAGEVKVQLQPVNADNPQADNLWRLGVIDNGIGLPPDFEAKRKTSLGLQLVSDLCRQIHGTLAIQSQPGAGAEFAVIFKRPSSAPHS